MIARRALDGALAILFALPLVPVWNEPSDRITFKLMVAAVGVLTALRPALGLCLLAALLPISPAVGSAMPMGSIAPEARALALAFLTAGFGRLTFAPAGPASRLAPPAWVLGGVVIAGGVLFTAAELATLRFPQALTEIWRHSSEWYFSVTTYLADLRRALAWLVALAVAVLAERVLRRDRKAIEPLVRLAIVGAALAAMYTVYRVGATVAGSPDVMATLVRTIREFRFNAFFADLNATGSLQVLFLIPAAWLAATRRAPWAWAAAIVLALALWLSGSRAAVLAAFGGAAIAWMLARRMPRRRLVTAGVLLAGAIAMAVWSTRPGRATVEEALTIRWTLAMASFRAAGADPVLGIGVDRLPSATAPFITPQFAQFWPPAAHGENAHNNFIQMLAETGLMGLAGFVWMLAASVGPRSCWRADAAADPDLIRPGLVGGLAGFLLTCLAGHPLLIEPVRLCFFLWLAAVAAGRPDEPATPSRKWPWRLASAALIVISIVVVVRLAAAR